MHSRSPPPVLVHISDIESLEWTWARGLQGLHSGAPKSEAALKLDRFLPRMTTCRSNGSNVACQRTGPTIIAFMLPASEGPAASSGASESGAAPSAGGREADTSPAIPRPLGRNPAQQGAPPLATPYAMPSYPYAPHMMPMGGPLGTPQGLMSFDSRHAAAMPPLGSYLPSPYAASPYAYANAPYIAPFAFPFASPQYYAGQFQPLVRSAPPQLTGGSLSASSTYAQLMR